MAAHAPKEVVDAMAAAAAEKKAAAPAAAVAVTVGWKNADAAAASTSAAGGSGEQNPPPPAAAKKVPMPHKYITAILSVKRERPLLPEELERLSPEERREVEEQKELDDCFEESQAEVRRQVEEYGCYMVEEIYFAETAEFQRELKEGWAKMDFSGIVVGD